MSNKDSDKETIESQQRVIKRYSTAHKKLEEDYTILEKENKLLKELLKFYISNKK